MKKTRKSKIILFYLCNTMTIEYDNIMKIVANNNEFYVNKIKRLDNILYSNKYNE